MSKHNPDANNHYHDSHDNTNHDNAGNCKDCNIVKDLLPLYLEELCTEDSRNYVEAHLAQCASCQNTYTILKHDIRDTAAVQDQEINAFKKLKTYFAGQMITGYLLFLAVLSIGVFTLLLTVSTNSFYFGVYALLMPLTILATDFAFHGKAELPRAKSAGTLLIPQVLLLLLSVIMMFYVFLTLYLNPVSTPLGIPLKKTGPVLAAIFWVVTLLSLILLALYLYQTVREKICYGIMPAVSILCIFLNLTYLSMLYRMSSFESLFAELLRNTLILCAISALLPLITESVRRACAPKKPFK